MPTAVHIRSFLPTVLVTIKGARSYHSPIYKAPLGTVTVRRNDPRSMGVYILNPKP